jgi:hypothetical protein
MIERRWLGHLTRVAAAGLLAACGASGDSSSFAEGSPQNGARAPSDEGSDGAGSFGRDDAGVPLEREEESAFEAPVATGKFVWIANPQSGRVAYINAETLDVRTVEAGNGPTFLAAVPSGESAIVLNVLSEDATLFRADGTKVESKTFKTAPGMNAWATSPDGRWAIAWADARTSPKNSDKTQGFQDLTVIDITGQIPPKVLAVGYRPVKVGFTAQGTRAYAVTQDGVALVDLTQPGGPLLTKNVALSDDALEDPGTRDVSVTPSGAYALIRRDNRADVTVLSLDSGARVTATLPGSVTDLDLTSSGDKAVAVIRQNSQVAILPVPDIFANPSTFTTVTVTGETIGSVALAPGGSTGLLYTNAVGTEHLTVMALAQNPSPTYRTVRLYSPVLSVFSSDDARHAVVIHEVAAGAKGAFSLVPIGAALPAKIVSTEGRPSSVAFAPTGDRAIVAEGGGAKGGTIYGAYLATLPELMVTRYPLASPPTAVGVMASAHRAYVAQKHPEGRITFIDMDGGRARTLTGFELAARVVDGSKP